MVKSVREVRVVARIVDIVELENLLHITVAGHVEEVVHLGTRHEVILS